MKSARKATVVIRHYLPEYPGSSFKIGVSVELGEDTRFASSGQLEDWLRNRLSCGVAQQALNAHSDPDVLGNVLGPHLFKDIGDIAMILAIKLQSSDGSERTVMLTP